MSEQVNVAGKRTTTNGHGLSKYRDIIAASSGTRAHEAHSVLPHIMACPGACMQWAAGAAWTSGHASVRRSALTSHTALGMCMAHGEQV